MRKINFKERCECCNCLIMDDRDIKYTVINEISYLLCADCLLTYDFLKNAEKTNEGKNEITFYKCTSCKSFQMHGEKAICGRMLGVHGFDSEEIVLEKPFDIPNKCPRL